MRNIMILCVLALASIVQPAQSQESESKTEPFAYSTLYGITMEANRYAQHHVEKMERITRYVFFIVVFLVITGMGLMMAMMPHAWQSIWAKVPSVMMVLVVSIMLTPSMFENFIYSPIRALFFAIPEWSKTGESPPGQGLFMLYERLGNSIGSMVDLADSAARIAEENERYYALFLALMLWVSFFVLFVMSAGSWSVVCVLLHLITMLLPIAAVLMLYRPLRYIMQNLGKGLCACMLFSFAMPYVMEISLGLLQVLQPHAQRLQSNPLPSGLPLHFVVLSLFMSAICIAMHRAMFQLTRHLTQGASIVYENSVLPIASNGASPFSMHATEQRLQEPSEINRTQGALMLPMKWAVSKTLRPRIFQIKMGNLGVRKSRKKREKQ